MLIKTLACVCAALAMTVDVSLPADRRHRRHLRRHLADLYLGVGPSAESRAGATKEEGQLYYLFLREDRL